MEELTLFGVRHFARTPPERITCWDLMSMSYFLLCRSIGLLALGLDADACIFPFCEGMVRLIGSIASFTTYRETRAIILEELRNSPVNVAAIPSRWIGDHPRGGSVGAEFA
jgi:hypothetical protein